MGLLGFFSKKEVAEKEKQAKEKGRNLFVA